MRSYIKKLLFILNIIMNDYGVMIPLLRSEISRLDINHLYLLENTIDLIKLEIEEQITEKEL